jgi:hypothetical protein
VTDLQELRELLDEEVFLYEFNPEWERVVNVKVVEAAEKYADPDYEAAARHYSDEVGRRSGSKLTWEAMYESEQADFLRVSTGAVNAALGITEKAGE